MNLGSPHYNLSPQGDGNYTCRYRCLFGARLQLIPARGRKLHDNSLLFSWKHITTYPRKGTETGSSPLKNVSTFNYNFSPQGDKKAPPRWYEPVRRGFAFQGSSVLGSAGGRSGGDGRVNGNFLDILRDVPLQGADLMQVGGDLSQGIFNALGIQRQNSLALQA